MDDQQQGVRRSSSFDPSAYWAARVSEPRGLAEVGHQALGPAYNAVIYRRRIRALECALEDLALDPRGAEVLELGCGTGFYVDFWRTAGIAGLTGVDISPHALDGLQLRYPRYRFLELDITDPDWSSALKGPFEIITLMDVVYHLLDDVALLHLLVNCARLLAPNGIVLVTEAGVSRRLAIARHVVFRSADEWNLMLSRAGLAISHRSPLFQLLEPPLCRSYWLSVAIAGVYRTAGVLLRRLPGLATATAERLALFDDRLLQKGARFSNHELWVLRRTGTAIVPATERALPP